MKEVKKIITPETKDQRTVGLDAAQGQRIFLAASQRVWLLMTLMEKYFGSERLQKTIARAAKKYPEIEQEEVLEFIQKRTGLKFNVLPGMPQEAVPEKKLVVEK